jgi:hypothetical protein
MMSANGLINPMYTNCQEFSLGIEQQFCKILDEVVVKSLNLVDNSLELGPAATGRAVPITLGGGDG